MFSFMANTLGHFYKNFQGFTYCSVFKVLCCFATARLIYHIFSRLSTAFLFLFSNTLRCLNGRFSSCSCPVSQGQGISYHPLRQKSTPFLQSFSNCFNCIYNLQKLIPYMGKMHRRTASGKQKRLFLCLQNSFYFLH